MTRAADLAARVWRSGDTSQADPSLLQAMSSTGNFVVGAFSGADLVGFSFGFCTPGPPLGLHSHMTCTSDELRGAGLGHALKLSQRAWALVRGIETITWTVDPLVRANAYFNLVKLRADVRHYLPNFYGAMADGVNAGDESDRLEMSWNLTLPERGNNDSALELSTAFRPDGTNVVLESSGDIPQRGQATGEVVGAKVPADIVSLRSHNPELALRWRRELRAALTDALAGSYRIDGFTRSGYYVLRRAAGAGQAE